MACRVVLAGAESAAAQVLRGLADSRAEPVAVFVEPEKAGGAGLYRLARELSVPTEPARRVKDPDLAHWIRDENVDLLLNVHSLYIMHGAVAEAPKIGSFNLHPGPLPAYAGLNTVTWAIANGEQSHGVTLHWMDAGLDTGPIAYSASFPIGADDTALSVFGSCIGEGVSLVSRLVESAIDDPASIPREPQHGERRLYRKRDVPADGAVRWDRPAREIHDLVRALDFGPFPSPCGHLRARRGDSEVAILGSSLTGRAADAPPGTVGVPDGRTATVAAADEWIGLRQVVVDERRVPADEALVPGERLGPGEPLT